MNRLARLVSAKWTNSNTKSVKDVSRVSSLHFVYSQRQASTMKRKPDQQSASKPKSKELPYHLTPSLKDEDGDVIWPAPKDQMQGARDIILAWLVVCYKTYCMVYF